MGHEAESNSHQLRDYDIVVMASDGVWDNLFESDVKNCIKQSMPRRKANDVNVAEMIDLQEAADCLGLKAE